MRAKIVCVVTCRNKLRAPLGRKWLILIFEDGVLGTASSLWVNVAVKSSYGLPASFCFYVFIKCVVVVTILMHRNSGNPCFLSSGRI